MPCQTGLDGLTSGLTSLFTGLPPTKASGAATITLADGLTVAHLSGSISAVGRDRTNKRTPAYSLKYTEAPPGYEIDDELGRGGMGVVYKARHVGLKRAVALKMLLGESHTDAAMLARFRVEAEAVAQLRHPNIVQVYDVGESGGRPYLALELLEGRSLIERLSATTLPAVSAADLMAALAGAIEATHRSEIVHRDLKPSNVFFSADGVPKVTDFGLAKRLEVEDGPTLRRQIMGSSNYMAPSRRVVTRTWRVHLPTSTH